LVALSIPGSSPSRKSLKSRLRGDMLFLKAL